MAGAIAELRFLTLEQAAEILQVSKRTLHRLIQRRQMPSLKIGGQWRIPEVQFLKWVEEKLAAISDLPPADHSEATRERSGSSLSGP
jgi:excisionase family DNA binding protein